MFKISKLADYAVIIVSNLPEASGEEITPLSAVSIASQTRLPEPTVGKILKMLSKAGIVNSTRGVSGGYTLSKAHSEISVADMIEAIEGPISLTDCVETAEDSCCDFIHSCQLSGRWNQVNHAVRKALANVSIKDMVSPLQGDIGTCGVVFQSNEEIIRG
tara:strand:+ start:215 stop:694 length:480 start_codon:yes stop_codon:yes gene_type:complete